MDWSDSQQSQAMTDYQEAIQRPTLTQHINDCYQSGMMTGAAFVDEPYIILTQKLYNITQDSQLCRVLQNMLSNRRFYVELNNERSSWKIQKNGLPQWSVLSPILYTNYVVVYPLPWPLLVGNDRSSHLWSTSQLLRPSGQQCSHSGGVYPQIQGWQCGAYKGAVEEMTCFVYVSVTKGA